MGALEMKNENVRAVGNMNVNAKGDVLDVHGNVIEHSNVRAERALNNQVSNVVDAPVLTKAKPKNR
jgi:hypothetical protein